MRKVAHKVWLGIWQKKTVSGEKMVNGLFECEPFGKTDWTKLIIFARARDRGRWRKRRKCPSHNPSIQIFASNEKQNTKQKVNPIKNEYSFCAFAESLPRLCVERVHRSKKISIWFWMTCQSKSAVCFFTVCTAFFCAHLVNERTFSSFICCRS